MAVHSKAPTAYGAVLIGLFCLVSVYNQLRITDAIIALSPGSTVTAERTRLAAGWVAGVTIVSHLGLCFILAMLMIAIARIQALILPVHRVLTAIGVAHVPLLAWAGYGTILFAAPVEKEQLEVFAGSIGRVMLARPFAYLGGLIWLIPLSVWQFRIGVRQAATLTLPPVLVIWGMLSTISWVANACPQ